jgi:sugar phosphate isomerase/epimerase
MIKSSVTISLVPEAKGGPFVFWDDLEKSIAMAAALRFDAVEIFPGSAEALDGNLEHLLRNHNLKLAAAGTGAGWVRHRLSLTDPDPIKRADAKTFVAGIIDAAARFGAPAIIGSMQGRVEPGASREEAFVWLVEALNELGAQAERLGTFLLYEPLNRYETNLVNRIADGVDLIGRLKTSGVKLLADLFHMNIEEQSLSSALRTGGAKIGHVHFVDSNRRPAGNGHLDFQPISAVLKEIGFSGYASAEALPWPSSEEAAKTTIEAFRQFFSR